MNILIDIGHPGHAHLFKNFAKIMLSKGHQVLFTTRDKEFEIQLLNHENFHYKCLGKHYKSKVWKVFGLLKFTLQIIIISLKFKPSIYLSHGSIYAAISSWVLRKPHIAFEDTFNNEQVRLYLPFTNCVLTGNYAHPFLGAKQINYAGYHELAYLHPNHFQPDISIKKKLGVLDNEKYFIIRFISWDASHDIGQKGLSWEQKRSIISLLNKNGKLFISSEKKLPIEFQNFNYPLPPESMHDALAFAQIFIGEGATMASECAMLGTPAVYVNSMEAGSINEQENFGLVHHYRNGNRVLEKIQELLEDSELKEKSKAKSLKLVNEKIDVTAFLVWFIENYPQSFIIMKENPDYQLRFK